MKIRRRHVVTFVVGCVLVVGAFGATQVPILPPPVSIGSASPSAAVASSSAARTATTAPASTSSCQIRGALPDPSCTPGATNPNVTQGTIGSTICVSGWTGTIRPPASYTTALKVTQMAAYGMTTLTTADVEEDHLIALELGGDPRDPRNLWPEPRVSVATPGAENKDNLENYLKREICAGRMQLADAQHAIATDWVTAWIAAGRP